MLSTFTDLENHFAVSITNDVTAKLQLLRKISKRVQMRDLPFLFVLLHSFFVLRLKELSTNQEFFGKMGLSENGVLEG